MSEKVITVPGPGGLTMPMVEGSVEIEHATWARSRFVGFDLRHRAECACGHEGQWRDTREEAYADMNQHARMVGMGG